MYHLNNQFIKSFAKLQHGSLFFMWPKHPRICMMH